MEVFNESVSNDSVDDNLKRNDQQQSNLIVNGSDKNVSLEKFIVLCRSCLNDSPNRRKKRYSHLRKTVARYHNSQYWNQSTFDSLLRRFSVQLESDEIDHEQADAIYKDLMKELTLLNGHVSCSGKCRKRKKKARKETTVVKLEKSLGVIQRRINRLRDEASANAWEVRDVGDFKCLKLHGMQKKALRLTKKINELSKLASSAANGISNLATLRIENNDEASGGSGGDGGGGRSGSSSGFNSNSDMDELNCLLKSVRLKESVKLKPKVIAKIKPGHFGNLKPSECHRSVYPRIEMVEIKKFDQHNQCYVEPSNKKSNSSKPMPFKIIRSKGANFSTLSSSYQSSPSSPNDTINSPDLRFVNTKSPTTPTTTTTTKKRSEIHKLRKQSTFDLICDRFRHVTLNS